MPSNTLTTLNTTFDNKKIFQMIDNYIYLYHLDTFIVLPAYADQINDSTQVTFSSSTPLSRSAPIYSYSNSGPRSVAFNFTLHRDMMTQINYGVSNAKFDNSLNDDYVDFMIKAVQAAALPKYSVKQKMVNPPIVAVRMGDDIFIKGVISGNVQVGYSLPILRNGKYAQVSISFSINEIEPYDANLALQNGSFRIPRTLDRNTWKTTSIVI